MNKAEQEQLIVGGEGSQQYAVRDFEAPLAAVNLQERNVRLQNIISHIEEKKKKEQYARVLNRDFKMDKNERDSRLANTQRSIESVTAQIHDEFAYVCGSYALLEAGVGAHIVRRLERRAFSDFMISAVGPKSLDKVSDTRTKLQQNYEHITSTTPLEIAEPELTTKEITKTKEKLRGTREDMLRILSDDRAGFNVFSNHEKNQVLPWLDYLDKPDEYPRGAWHQLEEVFRHQQKYGYGVEGGYDAVRSIVYEVTDFYQNAKSSLENMEAMQRAIEELPHYRNSLTEELGGKHPAYAPLVRFVDMNHFVNDGKLPVAKALQSKITRFDNEAIDKHKKVEDRYTASDSDPEFASRVQEAVQGLRVVDARPMLKDAIESERLRVAFYKARLEDIVVLAPNGRILRSIASIAEEALAA